MNKKILSIILVILLLSGLCSCGKQIETESAAGEISSSGETITDETSADITETEEPEAESDISLTTFINAITETVTTVFSDETKADTTAESTTTAKETTTRKAAAKQTTSQKTDAKETTSKQENICTISIKCTNASQNPDKLTNASKAQFVPSDGVILAETKVAFTEGDTVFDILKKVCSENKCKAGCQYCKNGIQLEYSFSSGYNNYYVEGIHQLYEKDYGADSGWMYKVNGVIPNYGCSDYVLKNGDKIEWVYTTDLGDDVA